MSTLKKLAKKAVRGAIKVASGAVRATPLGMAVSTAASALTGRGGGSGGSPQAWNPPGIQLPGGLSIDLPFSGRPGYGVMATGARRGRVAAGPKGECPKGYHLNKTATSDGQPARSFCVRNRHVNFANGRAARRAGRRLKGTVRQLRRSFSLVAAKAPKGKWVPKGGRKR
jgi:hypothetical protein